MEKITASTESEYASFNYKHVQYFEGKEGVKEVFKDTLNAKTHIFAALHPSKVDPEIREWIRNYYVPKRIEKNIFAYVFITSEKDIDKKAEEYVGTSREKSRVVQLVEDKGFPFEMEVNCYDDKVAFIQYNPEHSIYGIIIKHRPIANTFRSIFLNFLWDPKEFNLPLK